MTPLQQSRSKLFRSSDTFANKEHDMLASSPADHDHEIPISEEVLRRLRESGL